MLNHQLFVSKIESHTVLLVGTYFCANSNPDKPDRGGQAGNNKLQAPNYNIQISGQTESRLFDYT